MARQVGVELDIFSGRPNPEWQLSAADAALFEQKLAALSAAEPGRITNPLSYRGFVVQSGDTTVKIQNGTVQATRASAVTHRQDTGRALERWLLSTGKPFVDQETYKLAERELPA